MKQILFEMSVIVWLYLDSIKYTTFSFISSYTEDFGDTRLNATFFTPSIHNAGPTELMRNLTLSNGRTTLGIHSCVSYNKMQSTTVYLNTLKFNENLMTLFGRHSFVSNFLLATINSPLGCTKYAMI